MRRPHSMNTVRNSFYFGKRRERKELTLRVIRLMVLAPLRPGMPTRSNYFCCGLLPPMLSFTLTVLDDFIPKNGIEASLSSSS